MRVADPYHRRLRAVLLGPRNRRGTSFPQPHHRLWPLPLGLHTPLGEAGCPKPPGCGARCPATTSTQVSWSSKLHSQLLACPCGQAAHPGKRVHPLCPGGCALSRVCAESSLPCSEWPLPPTLAPALRGGHTSQPDGQSEGPSPGGSCSLGPHRPDWTRWSSVSLPWTRPLHSHR